MRFIQYCILTLCLGAVAHTQETTQPLSVPPSILALTVSTIHVDKNYEFLQTYLQQDLSQEQRAALHAMLDSYRTLIQEIRDSHTRNYATTYLESAFAIFFVPFLAEIPGIQKTLMRSPYFVGLWTALRTTQIFGAGIAMAIAHYGYYLAEQYQGISGDVQLQRIDTLLLILANSPQVSAHTE